MRKEIRQLLLNKDASGTRSFLESLPRNEKGQAFEQFLEELYNGNGYKAVRQGGKGDGGADLLLYEPSEEGVFCIVQAKNESKPLTFDKTIAELHKFETKASSTYGCNEFEIVSMNGFVKDAKKLTRFRLNLRDWEYVSGLIESYDPDSESVPHIRLHAHNQTAFDAVMEGLEVGNKVACVQATGTGKSYVIGAVMNQFADEQKLLLAPSKYIINQQSQVARWLNPSTEYKTYQSLPNLEVNEITTLNPSLIVLDEFHRAGAESWGDGVEKVLEAFPDAKVLGTTATPIRYLDDQRDMSDELFDMEAVNLPLAEAIQRRILPSPIYISSLYTLREEADALLQDLKKSQRTDAEKEVIKDEIDRAVIDWEKTSGVVEILKKYLGDRKCGKFVVFCKDIKHLKQLEDEVRKWFEKTGLFEAKESYRVHSRNKKSNEKFREFLAADDDSTAHILLAVDMLNEGIHASDIDAVLLFRPTTSPRIFYQQIGRCLQVGSKSNPIIFDFVNNFQSIRANDFLSDLEASSEQEREIRSQSGLHEDYLPEIHVHDESKEVLKFFEEIEKQLGLWHTRFDELVAFKESEGHCRVPDPYDANPPLSRWVGTQRKVKKGLDKKLSGKLDLNKQERIELERVALLDSIGFSWNPFQDIFNERLKQAKEFKEKHGHCDIPATYEENPQLGNWASRTRKWRERLDTKEHWDEDDKWLDNKLGQLADLGFVFDPFGESLQVWLAAWESFKEEHGHGDVPGRYTCKNKDDPNSPLQLGSWVSNTRQKKKALDRKIESGEELTKNDLEKQRIFADLEERGFIWNANDARWNRFFESLQKYKKTHKHLDVEKNEDKKLYVWIRTQRDAWKKLEKHKLEGLELEKSHRLNEQRFSLLESIGFVFDIDEHEWQVMFARAKAFKRENLRFHIPLDSSLELPVGIGFPTLGSWANGKRRRRTELEAKQKEQTPLKEPEETEVERLKQLAEIGFIWNLKEYQWQTAFAQLKLFKEKYQHCAVPIDYSVSHPDWKNEVINLGAWLADQRKAKRAIEKKKRSNRPLTSHEKEIVLKRIQQLESIGCIWDVDDEYWEKMYAQLSIYFQANQNCLVPGQYVVTDPLAEDGALKLGNWVGTQRKDKKKIETKLRAGEQLSAKDKKKLRRFERLDELGFVWDVNEHKWQIMFSYLKAYQSEQKHCRVPVEHTVNDPNDPNMLIMLGEWVSKQRVMKKTLDKKEKAGTKFTDEDLIKKERVKKLDAIGFVWQL